MRIDKLLADAANVTRSEARKLIKSGRVSVSGEVVRDESRHFDEDALIELDGCALSREKFVYIMMNKPSGVLTAARDKSAPTVIDLLEGEYKRANPLPAGRLDKDTAGLLILTNDGAAAHRWLSPKSHVKKTYIAALDGEMTDTDAKMIASGVDIGGYVTAPASLFRIDKTTWRITVTEGKFHQIKRMFFARGFTVTNLKRVEFGGVALDEKLPEGGYRPLTEEEKRILGV